MKHPAHRLPAFDQAATDRRFLAELSRLLAAGAFTSYRELATVLGIRPGVLSEIQTGRYHCNLKLLYSLARHYPQANVEVVFYGTPAPAVAPPNSGGLPDPVS